MAEPRTEGRIPSQRVRPALPSLMLLQSGLPTCPTVAMHRQLISLTSPEGKRTWAYSPSFAISCAEAPAERTICPPLPGCISILWIKVPTGMFEIGRALPGRISALALVMLLGRRRGFPNDAMEPNNIPMVVLGAGLLWFGWFGFNAGSALTSGGLASSARRLSGAAALATNRNMLTLLRGRLIWAWTSLSRSRAMASGRSSKS